MERNKIDFDPFMGEKFLSSIISVDTFEEVVFQVIANPIVWILQNSLGLYL